MQPYPPDPAHQGDQQPYYLPSYPPPYAYGYPPRPDQQPSGLQPRGRRVRIAVAGIAALAAVCATAGFFVGRATVVQGSGTVAASAQSPQSGSGLPGGSGGFPGGPSGGSSAAGGSTGTATARQTVGVVDIYTVLGYQHGEAAGTGTVVASTGEILTNNHVVQGSTSVKVTVVSTGKTYSATVVGTDATDDVAVLQASGVTGLSTANYGHASSVRVGDAVVGVGNAGGSGGTPSAASGQVVALDQTLTATDGNGSNAETLTGMIESDAPIVAGDSGGPLYNSSGQVVGMDTAAETGRGGATVAAYAIPIDRALSIAGQIESGTETSTVHIGSTGFLGVSVADSGQGALVEDVVSGAPADKAGIAAGDVITAVGGSRIDSSAALHTALSSKHGGDKVTLTWTDGTGNSHSATLSLIAGPAD